MAEEDHGSFFRHGMIFVDRKRNCEKSLFQKALNLEIGFNIMLYLLEMQHSRALYMKFGCEIFSIIFKWRTGGILMQTHIREFIQIVSSCLPATDPIYEFGALQVPGQEGFADLRPFFPNREYVGCDIREGTGVDKILDLHQIDLPSEYVGTVLCLDTLEHVEDPRRAVDEMHRILKPNGFIVISSVMNFPIHNFPNDYWRFTPQGFTSLLKPFASSFTGFAGDRYFPHTIVGIGFKGQAPELTELEVQYNHWRKPLDCWMARLVTRLTPPILHPFLSKVYKAAKHR